MRYLLSVAVVLVMAVPTFAQPDWWDRCNGGLVQTGTRTVTQLKTVYENRERVTIERVPVTVEEQVEVPTYSRWTRRWEWVLEPVETVSTGCCEPRSVVRRVAPVAVERIGGDRTDVEFKGPFGRKRGDVETTSERVEIRRGILGKIRNLRIRDDD